MDPPAGPFDLWRARRDFARAGLTADPSPTLALQSGHRALSRIFYALRDAAAVVRDVFWRV
jgi:hypothetical protein